MNQRFSIMRGFFTVFTFLAATVLLLSSTPLVERQEYKIQSIDAKNWVITAQETATGNIVKFRLPPSALKGKTFDADLGTLSKGQHFSVRGPRNARVNNLVLEKGQPKLGDMGLKQAQDRGPRKRKLRGRRQRTKLRQQQDAPLAWQITDVDEQRWICTAKNRQNGKVIKFQAHPEAFTGFLFHANLRGLKRGHSFSIVTPNNVPIKNACTLLEIK